jgi:DedD protein
VAPQVGLTSSANRFYTSPVERHVKERLIGAAVLMAAAIILVPEMLSGPPEEKRAETPRPSGETPVKTYTIDLSGSTSAAPGGEVPDTRAPPSEASPAGAPEPAGVESGGEAPQADPESESSETAGQVAASAPLESPQTTTPSAAPSVSAATPAPPAASGPVAARQPPPAVEPAPRAAIATAASAPKSPGSGWAVQLGSFSSQATAERLSAELRRDGYDAFVMPVKSNSATLYRVRIGPVPSREQADATLRQVKGKVPGAAVVAHR